jgi:hypothetical protein
MALKHSPIIVTDGLVLCLDAANSKSYPGSGTTWTDLSGRGNNATMSNITFNSLNGGSMVFNGTSSSISNTLAKPSSNNTILFDFWINSDTSSPVGIFDTAPQQIDVMRNYNPGYFEWWSNSPQVPLGITSGLWTNIAIQCSFSTQRIVTYYRNGSLISTTLGNFTPSYTWSLSSIVFGNIDGGSAGWYSGKIANIKIYNRALSATEIKQNYYALKGRFGL